MVIGEAPGVNEEAEGRPFVGASGRLLRRRLRHQGIDPDQVFYTNVAKYRPDDNKITKFFNRKGVPGPEVLEGLMELEDEIKQVDPVLIIPVGGTALWACRGKGRYNPDPKTGGWRGISDWRGSVFEGKAVAEGYKILPTYHPAAATRQPILEHIIDFDFQKAKKEMAFRDVRRVPRELIINPKGMDREFLKDWLLASPAPISFDIEYSAKSGYLHCVGFTVDRHKAFTIRTQSGSDIAFVRDILLSGHPLCAQNAMFDCSILAYWYKIDCFDYLVHDTMIAQHVAYLEMPKDLGFLCSLYTDQPCYWDEIDWKTYEKAVPEEKAHSLGIYNCIDTWVTHQVMEEQRADELQDGRTKKFFDHEMALIKPLWDISRRGIRIDKYKIAQTKADLKRREQEMQIDLNVLANKQINVKSYKDLDQLLFTDLKLFPTGYTPTRRPATDDANMLKILKQCTSDKQITAVTLIRGIRQCRDMQSKFYNIKTDPDSRMRTHYNPAGTNTGRLSSRKFYPTGTGANHQNIPRTKLERSMFVADPGYEFFYNDLERAESLVVAHISGDELLLEIHGPGKDAHRITARMIFNLKPDEEVPDDLRTLSKRGRHAFGYLMGPNKLMEIVNAERDITGISITLSQATSILNSLRRIHPGVCAWWDDVKGQLYRHHGCIDSLHGRRRKFFAPPDRCLPDAVAFGPQSTVGDTLNIALLRIHNDPLCRELGVELLLQVHDAIGGQFPVQNRVPAMRRLRELMRVDIVDPRTKETFFIPIECASGPSWGEVRKWAEADFN